MVSIRADDARLSEPFKAKTVLEKVYEMAGQAGRRGTDQTGWTDVRSASGRPRAARPPDITPQPFDVDERSGFASPTAERVLVPVEAPLGPDVLPRTVRTQASYRLLTATGLTEVEAAGVIGYVVGLKPGEQPWTLKQVNKALFLRELYASDDWGEAERKPA